MGRFEGEFSVESGDRSDVLGHQSRLRCNSASWQDVIDASAPHGLAPLSGSLPSVGAVSYTLGGGIGLLARKYGFAADHVHSLEMVSIDGLLRRVTAADEPELFWALRGGGGNFGVVTGMEIALMPVARLYGGCLFFDLTQTPEVLRAWREWTATVPEEMTSAVSVIPFPDVPGVPEPMRGQPVARRPRPTRGDRTGTAGQLRSGHHLCDRNPTPRRCTRPVPANAECPRPPRRQLLPGHALPARDQRTGHGDRPARGSPRGVRPTRSRTLTQLHLRPLDQEQVRAAYEPADWQRLTQIKVTHDPRVRLHANHLIPPHTADHSCNVASGVDTSPWPHT